MTFAFQKGRYGVKLAGNVDEIAACQRLRHLCFFGGAGRDVDPYDDGAVHVMVSDGAELLATCRAKMFEADAFINISYAAERYDLISLSKISGVKLEVGRVCAGPGPSLDADILRSIWGALARLVVQHDVELIFGCASFAGTEPLAYRNAFALLGQRFCAPPDRLIRQKADEVITLQTDRFDHRAALAELPPLLRTYLAMGGWVSDHAVVDRDMNTLHVFCGVEVSKVPPARAKALRALAG